MINQATNPMSELYYSICDGSHEFKKNHIKPIDSQNNSTIDQESLLFQQDNNNNQKLISSNENSELSIIPEYFNDDDNNNSQISDLNIYLDMYLPNKYILCNDMYLPLLVSVQQNLKKKLNNPQLTKEEEKFVADFKNYLSSKKYYQVLAIVIACISFFTTKSFYPINKDKKPSSNNPGGKISSQDVLVINSSFTSHIENGIIPDIKQAITLGKFRIAFWITLVITIISLTMFLLSFYLFSLPILTHILFASTFVLCITLLFLSFLGFRDNKHDINNYHDACAVKKELRSLQSIIKSCL